MYGATIAHRRYGFDCLAVLLAKASPLRSGDQLAGVAAETGEERVAAQVAPADLTLKTFLDQAAGPYETDEATRLIADSHDRAALAPIPHLTVSGPRASLLSDHASADAPSAPAPGL